MGGDLASNSNDILMAANDRIVFGSDALRVKHTGSHADIENTTGNITIKNDSSSSTEQILIQAKGGEDSIKAIANGAVELYHDNSKRLETSADGIILTPDASGVLISSGGDTNWTTGAMNVVKLGGNQADIRLGSNYGVRIGISGNNDANEFMIQQDNSNNAYVRNEATNPIRFQTGGSNTRFQIDNSGDCTINDGNLVIGTSGHGISFAASSDASGMTNELLDDYEEGSWTPDFRVHTYLNNANSFTYGSRSGQYTRVGRLVHVTGFFNVTNFHTYSGNLYLFGLPFAPVSGSQPVLIMVGDHANFSDDNQMGMFVIVEGGNSRGVVGHQRNTGWSHMTRSEMKGGGGYVSGSYYV